MLPPVEVKSITKVYSGSPWQKSNTVALDNISLKINEGQIYALLGLNGAGKTTLMKIILGLTHPTRGNVLLFGTDIHRNVARKIGYFPEALKGNKEMTVVQLLKYIGRICGIKAVELEKKVEFALEEFDLKSVSKQKMNTLSKGTLNRVGIAQALLDEPELLLLDEPTDGLDPVWRKNIRELLLKLKKMGITILLNSHLLSEIEIIVTRWEY